MLAPRMLEGDDDLCRIRIIGVRDGVIKDKKPSSHLPSLANFVGAREIRWVTNHNRRTSFFAIRLHTANFAVLIVQDLDKK